MPIVEENEVQFDVTLKAPGGTIRTVRTLEAFRPSANTLVHCERWLNANGVEAHSSGFGLSCQTDKETFEALFHVELRPVPNPVGVPAFEFDGHLEIPEAIASDIVEITLTGMPEYF